MFAAERVLRAVEQGEAPAVKDVRELARSVLASDPMTALALRLMLGPAARIRASQAAELAGMVLERVRATNAADATRS